MDEERKTPGGMRESERGSVFRRGVLVRPAANLNPLEPVSGDKGFPLHGPAEWLRHGGIEIGDEALDPLLEMVLRCEIAAPEELSDQDREPNLDLVDP